MTWRHLNKEPHHIAKHVQGKRFQRAYAHCKSRFLFLSSSTVSTLSGQECQANGTEYVPIGRKKKKQKMATDDDDDQYVDLSDDEIIIEDDNDDDLSDLYPGMYPF